MKNWDVVSINLNQDFNAVGIMEAEYNTETGQTLYSGPGHEPSPMLSILHIPNEILAEITSGLSVRDLLALGATCRGLNQWHPGHIIRKARDDLLRLLFRRAAEIVLIDASVVPSLVDRLVVVQGCNVNSSHRDRADVTVIMRRGRTIDLVIAEHMSEYTTCYSNKTVTMYRGEVFWPSLNQGPSIGRGNDPAFYACHVRRVSMPVTYIPYHTWYVVTHSGVKAELGISNGAVVRKDGLPPYTCVPLLEDALLRLQ